jgi:hypothetical protein
VKPAAPAALAILLVLGAARPVLGGATRVGPKSVALVLDTSRSMIENDPQRYTLEISQILSDLLDDGDELTVVRMPTAGLLRQVTCADGVTPSLALASEGSDRAGFKLRLGELVRYDTGTFFAAPLRTAMAALRRHPERPRLLLVVADSGGLGNCEAPLTRELLSLAREGATLAAINLGGDAGAFDRNPAFHLTTAVRDAEELIAAVARVYQRFLGGRQVATGNARGQVEVEVAPHVREAFVVFAADGPLGAVSQAGGNPGAAQVELNFRGGGGARGLDGREREYRIVHLLRPDPGRFRFEASGLATEAGWMLIQDSSLGVRLSSSPTVAAGAATTIEVQLVDEETGAVVADSTLVPGLSMTVEVEGRSVTLRDDGGGGDRAAGDGVFSSAFALDRLGRHELAVHLASDQLDRRRTLGLDVVEGGWQLRVATPPAAPAGSPVELSVEAVPVGSAARLTAPKRVEATVAGEVIALMSSGAGDLRYSATWVAAEPGAYAIEYRAVGGSEAPPVSAPLAVSGVLVFGEAKPVVLPPVGPEGEAVGELALTGSTVRGTFVVEATSEFARRRATIEIDPGGGWMPLGETPVALDLRADGPAAWPVRLRTASCPAATAASEPFTIRLSQRGGGGEKVVPLSVTIQPESWWVCWWPLLALLAVALAAVVVIHGYVSPSRFAPRLGVWLSPELDLAEGFFHPIHGTRGTGSGFYRDAAVYICGDYRLSARSGGAVARLRADARGVQIRPAHGAALFRQTADGRWEALPAGETASRLGALYRNDSASLFFEVRHG